MVQAYGPAGLKQYRQGRHGDGGVIDSRKETANLYAQLAILAAGAKQDRKADLAEQKALDAHAQGRSQAAEVRDRPAEEPDRRPAGDAAHRAADPNAAATIGGRAPVAQLAEQRTLNPKVQGSIPCGGMQGAATVLVRADRARPARCVRPCSRSSTAPSSTPSRRRSRSPTRACCAATASSRSCASTAAARSRFEEHLDAPGALGANLRLPIDLDAVRADVDDAARAQRRRRTRLLRVVVTRGGRRLALVEALQPLPETLAPRARSTYAPTRVLDGVKSLSYGANMLATRLAQEQGADEALLVTPHGRVLEAPTASFVCSLDGETLVHAAALRPHPRLDHAPPPARRSSTSPSRSDRARRSRRAAARRSSPRRCARSMPVHAIDGVALPRGARPAHAATPRAGSARTSPQRAGRLRLTACASSPSSGTGRSSSRPPRSRACCAPSTTSCSSTPASTTTTSCRRSSSTSWASRARSASSASTAARTPSRRRACSPRSGRCSPRSAPTRCSSTATRTRRSPAALAAAQARDARSRTSRPACARSTARCRRSSTASSPTTSPTCCCARRRRPSRTSRARASPGASSSSAT